MNLGKIAYISLVNTHRSSIMGIAILSIILFHQPFTSVIPINVFHNYGHWGVEIFLFLSGMGMVNSLRRKDGIGHFYKRRFIRLFPACILLGTLKYVLYSVSPDLQLLKEGLHLGWWSCLSFDLWYIDAIIFYYTITPILYSGLEKYSCLSLAIVFLVCVFNQMFIGPIAGKNWATPLGLANWILSRLPVFTIGMYVAIRSINRVLLSVSAGCFIIAVIIVLLKKIGLFVPLLGIVGNLCIAIGTPFMVLICVVCIVKSPNAVSAIFKTFGNLSLEIYLIHEFVIWSFYIKWHDEINGFLLLPITVLCFYVIAYGCNKLCSFLLTFVKH